MTSKRPLKMTSILGSRNHWKPSKTPKPPKPRFYPPSWISPIGFWRRFAYAYEDSSVFSRQNLIYIYIYIVYTPGYPIPIDFRPKSLKNRVKNTKNHKNRVFSRFLRFSIQGTVKNDHFGLLGTRKKGQKWQKTRFRAYTVDGYAILDPKNR